MCSALQIGASIRLANRRPTRLKTVATPRKWSMRKMSSSGTTLCRRVLNATADAWSVPNGFSSASRVVLGQVDVLEQVADLHRHLRRQREEDHQGPVAAPLDKSAQGRLVEQVRAEVCRVLRDRGGHPRGGLGRGEGVLDPGLPGGGREVDPVGTDDADRPLGLDGEQAGQPRQQQPVGQVTPCAEDQQGGLGRGRHVSQHSTALWAARGRGWAARGRELGSRGAWSVTTRHTPSA